MKVEVQTIIDEFHPLNEKMEDDDEWTSPNMNKCSTFMNDIYLGMES
jgi:hypothetical protein